MILSTEITMNLTPPLKGQDLIEFAEEIKKRGGEMQEILVSVDCNTGEQNYAPRHQVTLKHRQDEIRARSQSR